MQAIQRQAHELRQQEEAQRLKLIEEQEPNLQREQNQGRSLNTIQGRGM
ncbi:hypothetical protein GCM10027423_52660 [Spirosoma arcticum]